MKTTSLIRWTGITLLCAGAGSLLHAWVSTRDLLRSWGGGSDTFVRIYFLGESMPLVDLNLHDTYYFIVNPVWGWLSVVGCLVGAIMAVRPDWVSKKPAGRE